VAHFYGSQCILLAIKEAGLIEAGLAALILLMCIHFQAICSLQAGWQSLVIKDCQLVFATRALNSEKPTT